MSTPLFIALGFGLVALFLGYRFRRVPVPRPRQPVSTPWKVLVAPGAAHYQVDAQKAVRAWRLHLPGSFDPAVMLAEHPEHGSVYIRLARTGELPDPTKARAYTFPAQGPIERAEIAIGRLEPGYCDLHLAHELGHCLGFKHPENGKAGHVMTRDADRIGWDFTGIR